MIPMSGSQRLFRLNIWMTLCAFPVLIALLALGTWQLERLSWKESLIAERRAKLAFPPIDIAKIKTIHWRKYEYRLVELSGRFLHEKEMFLQNSVRRGMAGKQIITPFLNDSGGHILVDRGWVPISSATSLVKFNRPTGRVKLTGVIREGIAPSTWTPDNRPRIDLWFYVDVGQMSNKWDISNFYPFYVRTQFDSGKTGYPLGTDFQVKIPNNHLQYAITWYGIAVALVIICMIYQVRSREVNN